ncbi:MAG: hypothetical protein M3137_19635 [Actinomycetota bacterium]|nr:hypothetical protein [Actinomycetota bacterium]
MASIVAFGAMALSGGYAWTAQHLARPGAVEEVRRYFAKPPRAEAAVLVVAPLGVVAVLVDPHGSDLGQLWEGVALLLWILASLLWVAVVRPAEAVIAAAMPTTDIADGTVDPLATATLAAPGRRLGRASVVTNVVFVAALALMVFQPG